MRCAARRGLSREESDKRYQLNPFTVRRNPERLLGTITQTLLHLRASHRPRAVPRNPARSRPGPLGDTLRVYRWYLRDVADRTVTAPMDRDRSKREKGWRIVAARGSGNYSRTFSLISGAPRKKLAGMEQEAETGRAFPSRG